MGPGWESNRGLLVYNLKVNHGDAPARLKETSYTCSDMGKSHRPARLKETSYTCSDMGKSHRPVLRKKRQAPRACSRGAAKGWLGRVRVGNPGAQLQDSLQRGKPGAEVSCRQGLAGPRAVNEPLNRPALRGPWEPRTTISLTICETPSRQL